MAKQTWIVSEDTKERLDKYLSLNTELSRTRVQQLADDGMILVNGKVAKSSLKVVSGDEISCDVPDDRPVDILPENIPLDILYEDSDIIVINKPKGMVVHPAPGNYSNTMVNALLYHCKDLSGINGVIRPGIVHRIDKDTTGCIVACKNDKAHEAIAKQLENKTCHRVYKTIVVGNITHDDGLVDAPIGRDPRDRQRMKVTEENSRDARTHFHVLERFNVATYLECRLETGRTHQIRAHMEFIKHPIVNDPLYHPKGKNASEFGQYLHARTLSFTHPVSGEVLKFQVEPPKEFDNFIRVNKGSLAD